MSILFCDFETRSTVNIKNAGADVYARDPSTEVLCMAYAFDEEAVEVVTRYDQPHEFHRIFNFVLGGGTVVAHNAAFELAIWNNVCVKKYGWPQLRAEQVICTMAMAYSMALPGALEDAAPAAGLDVHKDTKGHRVMLQLSQPKDGPDPGCLSCSGTGRFTFFGIPVKSHCDCVEWYTPETHFEKFLELYAYCAQDIEVERQLYKRLLPLSAAERELWILDYKINQRGVQIDVKAVEKAWEIAQLEKKRLDGEMKDLNGFFPAEVTQLVRWLNSKGVETEGLAKSDVVKLLERTDLPSDVRRAIEIRQLAAKTSTAKLPKMLSGVCEDGRARGLFQYWGAGATGRFAGRRIQLHNLPRPRIPQSQIDHVFQILEEVK